MFGVVYKVVNKVNGKIYIGITKRPLKFRWSRHVTDANQKYRDCYFTNAINKYSSDNFTIFPIDSSETREDLLEREKMWIELYSSTDPNIGYNYQKGGEEMYCTRKYKLGFKHTEESKKKMSESQKKKAQRPHTRKLLMSFVESKSIKVICNETGELFDSGRKAAKALGLHSTAVSQYITGKTNFNPIHGFTFKKA